MSASDLLGPIASVMSFLLFLPQAMKTWQNRNDPHALRGLSIWTQVALLANALLWAGYGLDTRAFWVAAPGLINGPLAIATIFLILRSRRPEAVIALGANCKMCDDGSDHQVFITSPPGWGSLMRCSPESRSRGVLVTDEESISRMHRSAPA